ncbi:MAG: 4-hydroxy-tetrahydrodipicolinate reductase [Coriobacteriales bacterium]|nr:4-hydroxy-tetrahydrodipicolinate reductase [Coriobacteriales bacterium]
MKTTDHTRPLRVLVNGFLGKMGSMTVHAINSQPDMVVAGGFDPASTTTTVVLESREPAPAFTDLDSAISTCSPDVMVDFTLPGAVEDNVRVALARQLDTVVGTSGLDRQRLEQLMTTATDDTAVFVAPNFSIGALLMMEASRQAARYFTDVEILEFHHNNKVDAPSATAIATAEALAAVRQQAHLRSQAPDALSELPDFAGARGANVFGIPVHSLRSDGFMAAQEVVFGSPGQTLSIRHDVIDRRAYMPGVLLAIRSVGTLKGLVIGLEELMEP